MPESNYTPYTRRQFLHQGITLASLAATTPLFLDRSARGMLLPEGSLLSSQPGVPEDHILVVVQLGGGNDGLNTVVPYGSREYYNARPGLAIPAPGRGTANKPEVLTLDRQQGLGLHPSLAGFKELMDEGRAAIIQGVGYPNPNRSHFTSMDIWHTADPSAHGHGWLGRYFDNTCNGRPEPDAAIAIGRTAPLALVGETHKPVTFEKADRFRWAGREVHESLEQPYAQITQGGALKGVEEDSQLGFLMRTAMNAQASSERIRKAVAKTPLVQYPRGGLGHQLRIVGSMIRDGLKTRVYYVSLGGFDTHANQWGTHRQLLQELGDALKAFQKDLKAQGNHGRVLTMVFSEFGRRVNQNASGGTDHGCAAPLYLVGEMVKPGLLGNHPSLVDLHEDLDLRYSVDFRSVYAGILEDWLGAPAERILGRKFPKAKIIIT